MSFEQALAYANRIYLANRREFDAVILPPDPPKQSPKLPKTSFPRTAATPCGAHACTKGFPVPRLRWTEHRGANP